MSYDLFFQRRDRRGVSAGEAESVIDAASWAAIVARAREILGPVEAGENAGRRQLRYRPKGVSLECSGTLLVLRVPYWTHGDAANENVVKLKELVRAIEQQTGLQCYDPQLDRPFLDAETTDSVAVFDQVADMFGLRAHRARRSAPA